MDFYILDENLIKLLSSIDCTEIIPMRNDICLVNICTTNSIIREAKYSWFLKREYFWPSLMRCNDGLAYLATIILHMDTELAIEDI